MCVMLYRGFLKHDGWRHVQKSADPKWELCETVAPRQKCFLLSDTHLSIIDSLLQQKTKRKHSKDNKRNRRHRISHKYSIKRCAECICVCVFLCMRVPPSILQCTPIYVSSFRLSTFISCCRRLTCVVRDVSTPTPYSFPPPPS